MTQKKTYEELRDHLGTGDIVLFSGKGGISDWIKLFTAAPWSHVGMVLKLDAYDMVLLWESTTLSDLADIEAGRARKGVQLVPLSERIGAYGGDIAVRKLSKRVSRPMVSRLHALRKQVSRRPYEEDKLELIKSAYDGPLGGNKENLSSLFCSELVAEAYQSMGLLREPPKGLPSNEYTPRDFSTVASELLRLQRGFSLGDEIWVGR